jgi:hypothetical protein
MNHEQLIEDTNELMRLVDRNRAARGVVMLCTLPNCPSCLAGNETWKLSVCKYFGLKQLRRENWPEVSDHELDHECEKVLDPFFVKALAPAALVWLHSIKNRNIPPVLYFGPDDLLFVGSVSDLEHDIKRLQAAVLAKITDTNQKQQGLALLRFVRGQRILSTKRLELGSPRTTMPLSRLYPRMLNKLNKS